MELQVVVMVDDEWPNGLPISCAAALDRENGRLLPAFKKAPILLDAQRRRLDGRVGPPWRCVILCMGIASVRAHYSMRAPH